MTRDAAGWLGSVFPSSNPAPNPWVFTLPEFASIGPEQEAYNHVIVEATSFTKALGSQKRECLVRVFGLSFSSSLKPVDKCGYILSPHFINGESPYKITETIFDMKEGVPAESGEVVVNRVSRNSSAQYEFDKRRELLESIVAAIGNVTGQKLPCTEPILYVGPRMVTARINNGLSPEF